MPMKPSLTPEELRLAQELAGERSILPARLEFTSMRDLLAEPDEQIRWLVADHLPAGGLSILCGKPKAGKSTLSRCLALSVARGVPWLGMEVSRGPVFYLALEEKRSEVRRHFRLMGASPEDPIHVFVAPSPQDGFGQLWKAADREKPALIVIDPLFRFTRVKDANDYAIVTSALEPLVVLARDTGAHVHTDHHLGKRGDSADGGDGILGSTAIFGSVDTALILRRTDRYRTLSSRQRYGVDLEETVLTLDVSSGWVTAAGSRQEADEATAEEAVFAYLEGQEEAVTRRDVLEEVEGKAKVILAALQNLAKKGKVFRDGTGRKGDPFKFRSAVPGIYAGTEKRNPDSEVSDRKDERNTVPENRPFSGYPGTESENPGTESEHPDDGEEKEDDWWV